MPLLHSWDLNPGEAIALQSQLARQIIADRPLPLEHLHLVAGVDVSVRDHISYAAIVLLTYPELELVETTSAVMPTPFPYIPGLLSFREGPVILQAWQQLQLQPDVVIFDGMGLAHPRRLGIACHLGLWLEKPTIGCGKTHFVGEYVEPGLEKGDWVFLQDRKECIGAILRTRRRVKPVYVSVGHLADLSTAVELTLNCTTRYRLPEPTRLAHQVAGRL